MIFQKFIYLILVFSFCAIATYFFSNYKKLLFLFKEYLKTIKNIAIIFKSNSYNKDIKLLLDKSSISGIRLLFELIKFSSPYLLGQILLSISNYSFAIIILIIFPFSPYSILFLREK